MTVYHPRSLETTPAGPPGGVTVGRETYTVDADGTIDCPEGVESDIAEALAGAYDVSVDEILDTDSDTGAVPDETPEAAPDYGEMTYDELYERAQDRDIAGRSEMDSQALRNALRED